MLDRLLSVLKARFGSAPALSEAPKGVEVLAEMANRRVVRFLAPSDVRNTTSLLVENSRGDDEIHCTGAAVLALFGEGLLDLPGPVVGVVAGGDERPRQRVVVAEHAGRRLTC